MKANETPEKIYIVIDPIWGSRSVNYNRNDTDNIEYIRTDAFIDKACEWLGPVFKDLSGYYSGAELLDDFKNYMKRE